MSQGGGRRRATQMGAIEAVVLVAVSTVGLCCAGKAGVASWMDGEINIFAGAAVTMYAPGIEPAVLSAESRLILDAVIAMLISSLLAIEIMTRLMPCRSLCGSIEVGLRTACSTRVWKCVGWCGCAFQVLTLTTSRQARMRSRCGFGCTTAVQRRLGAACRLDRRWCSLSWARRRRRSSEAALRWLQVNHCVHTRTHAYTMV